MIEHRGIISDGIRERIDIFKENSGNLNVDVMFFPDIEENWNVMDEEKTNELKKLLDDGREILSIVNINMSQCETVVKEYDAYYGSASPLVPVFSQNKKPVMIADYDI
jgi:hypothetical protein